MPTRSRLILGWSAVGLSTVLAGFWAFWGAIENFHEGWYYRSMWMNLAMMIAQYLLPVFLFVGAAIVAIRWRRPGGLLHAGIAP